MQRRYVPDRCAVGRTLRAKRWRGSDIPANAGDTTGASTAPVSRLVIHVTELMRSTA
jgi:hypothetical protein